MGSMLLRNKDRPASSAGEPKAEQIFVATSGLIARATIMREHLKHTCFSLFCVARQYILAAWWTQTDYEQTFSCHFLCNQRLSQHPEVR